MTQKQQLPIPQTLPATGKSRFSQFKKFSPVSKEKFRQLCKEELAPQPERMGIRCTFSDNQELHRWLADPLNYRTGRNHVYKCKRPTGAQGRIWKYNTLKCYQQY